ncbi:B3 domain-containing protein LOC_Os12g40080-like isoform X2 [Durio zibethinus]|uniref:B3 domain-containing protein LOC_Os12g40080-like isoform X2 n=1 Tax=Durio zibethinus TaxID=66656 RepID=A0A6P5YII9_DURZI|nr:B3 domain-containing protein LOC_Os12g40080-like isoform X2 [Durio zibethinus]
MFTPKTPHFFKIILEAAIRDRRLGIPRKFVRKYGNGLSSPVVLMVPGGATWHVELTKSDGVVWLQNGWQEFAEHYSLKYGHLLVFRYEGNCKFQVLIFDMSASEIEYPYISYIEDHQSDEECQKPDKEEAETDTFDENLYETLPHKKTRKKSRPPCSLPRKKLRTTPTDKRGLQTKVPRERHAFGANEYDKALQRASSFTLDNPFFVCIPTDFTTRFLKENLGDVTLCTLDGKTWSAQYWRYISRNKYIKAILYNGWREFMQYNKLEAGDVCVFELIRQTEILLNVVIYRVRQDTSCCSKLCGISFSANASNGRLSTQRNTKSKHLCMMRPLTSHEKARATLRASNFKSENPFFKVVMQLRYLKDRCSLSIPYKFVKRYLDEKKDQVILQVSDGRTWIVKFSVKVFTCGQHKAEFYHAWRAFARDNNLEVGDVCVFELINHNKTSFKVSIFPAAPGADFSLSSQGNSSCAAQLTAPRYQASGQKTKPSNCLPCPRPCKTINGRFRTNSTLNTRINSFVEAFVPNLRPDDNKFREIKLENPNENQGYGATSTRRKGPQTEGTRRTQPLRAGEKTKALQRASSFKSQNPFFVVVMQPSYVCSGHVLAIPLNFSRNYLRKRVGVGDVILCMKDGKTWWTKYYREANKANPRARLIEGWRAFAEDNNLGVGDVCVFEKIKSKCHELSFNVIIYRAEVDEK